MPKRTNEFQALIAMLEEVLKPQGGRVEESKELHDKRTGQLREVDIVLEASVGGHEIVVGIECTARSRPADSHWVETILGKHADLPVDKTILVSKSGFYAPALEKARAHGVEALTLSDAEGVDWARIVAQLREITVVTTLNPYATNVTLIFDGETKDGEAPRVTPSSTLHFESTNRDLTLREYVADLLAPGSAMGTSLIEQAFTDAPSTFEFTLRFPPKTLVETASGFVAVAGVEVKGKCAKETITVPLDPAMYGKTAVATASFDSMQHRVEIAFVEQEGVESRAGIRVHKNANT